jgi:hypothetical protein
MVAQNIFGGLCVVIIETYGGIFVSAQENSRGKRDKTAKIFYSVFW